MGSRHHHALSWSVAPLQLICKGCSFPISLPEIFTLSFKCPPHLKVPSSASSFFLVNESHCHRNLLGFFERRQLFWWKKQEEGINTSFVSQHQVPLVSGLVSPAPFPSTGACSSQGKEGGWKWCWHTQDPKHTGSLFVVAAHHTGTVIPSSIVAQTLHTEVLHRLTWHSTWSAGRCGLESFVTKASPCTSCILLIENISFQDS